MIIYIRSYIYVYTEREHVIIIMVWWNYGEAGEDKRMIESE
jgi:hypothetical protein